MTKLYTTQHNSKKAGFRGKLVALLATLVAVALISASCGSSDSTNNTDGTSSDTFRMGYLLPITGDLAHLADPMIKALELAAEEINLLGVQKVELFSGDSGTDATIANNTVDSLLADNVQGIVGASASAISLAVIEKVAGAEMVMISPSNTSPTLSSYEDDGYYFRTVASDILLGPVMADFITEIASSVAILFRSDDYAKALSEITTEHLLANGLEVSASLALAPEASSFAAEVQQASSAGVDGVLIIAFEECTRILTNMIEIGIGPGDDVTIWLAPGCASNRLWQDVDPADPAVLEGIFGVQAIPTEGAEATFPERFERFAPGVEQIYSPHSYDAAMIMALAAFAAGSNEPADYASYINDITRGGTKCDRYAVCIQLLQDGQDIDYDGASGPLEFLEQGEPGVATFNLYRFDDQGMIQTFRTTTIGNN